MIRSLRRALLIGAGLSLLAATAHAAPPVNAWPQDRSDLTPDAAVRFGRLPNGMGYAIMRNDTPTHQVSLRLRIGSGSLEESDAEQGLAHFLEHMAFDGSTHVAKGEVVRTLERLGLAFGADTNASTAFTQTVFQFDLPENDAKSVGTGLMLMREIAGNLTLSADAMNPERGVVLSEERLRDTPNFEVEKGRLNFDFAGQLVAHRLPIGQVSIIQNATPAQLRTYYDANYRPDRATLIVTGDIDPAAIEQEISARFGDWTSTGPEASTPDYGAPERRGRSALLQVRPGATPTIAIDWVAPYDATPDSTARERRDIIERVGLLVLDRRLARLANGDNPPFLQAGVFRQNFERSAKPATLQVMFRSGQWRPALDAAVTVQRQALTYGVTQAEVDREVTEWGVQLQTLAEGSTTRRTPDLANELVRTVDEAEVDTSPGEDLALYRQVVKGLTAAEVDQALRTAFTGSGPLLSMSSPDPVDGGEAAVQAAFDRAEAAPIVRPAALAARTWTHTQFGAPGRVVEQRSVPDLGLTFVRFANGVRLTVKPTAFRKDQVEVAVDFGHGRLGMPRDRLTPWWASEAFVTGGLDDLAYEDLQQVLADRTVSARLAVEDDTYSLSGITRPQDLDTQLQLLAAYMTRPGWRADAFDHARSMMSVMLPEMSATPQGVESRDLPELERSGDDRWKFPTVAELPTQDLLGLKRLLAPALASGPLEVVVVGDVDVDRTVRAVAATFGALPARPPEPEPAGADRLSYPAPDAQPRVERHTGRADQAIAYIGWPTVDFLTDPQEARVVNLTSEVLGSRLVDQFRISEGATYSPVSMANPSEVFPGFGYAFTSVETPPAKLQGFYADADRIVDDMGRSGVTADELERAKAPRLEQLRKAQQTNEYWLSRLQHAQTEPRRLAIIRDTLPGYEKISADDIRQAAARYFTSGRAWRLEIEPVNPAASASPDAAAIAVPPVRPPTADSGQPFAPRPGTPPAPGAPSPGPRGPQGLTPQNPTQNPATQSPAAPSPEPTGSATR